MDDDELRFSHSLLDTPVASARGEGLCVMPALKHLSAGRTRVELCRWEARAAGGGGAGSREE